VVDLDAVMDGAGERALDAKFEAQERLAESLTRFSLLQCRHFAELGEAFPLEVRSFSADARPTLSPRGCDRPPSPAAASLPLCLPGWLGVCQSACLWRDVIGSLLQSYSPHRLSSHSDPLTLRRAPLLVFYASLSTPHSTLLRLGLDSIFTLTPAPTPLPPSHTHTRIVALLSLNQHSTPPLSHPDRQRGRGRLLCGL
jgi:hypothetical protein